MAEQPTIKNFLRAFGGQWFTKMSGPLTVPFAFFALYVPQTWLKVLFVILAVICALVASYGIWAAERRARNAAELKAQNLQQELAEERTKPIPFSQRANIEVVQMNFASFPYQVGEPIEITVRLRNRGVVPANNYMFTASIGFCVHADDFSTKDEEKKDQDRVFEEVLEKSRHAPEFGNNSWNPDADNLITVQYPVAKYNERPLIQAELDQIQHRQRAIVICGICRYVDEYGPRESHFAWCFTGKSEGTVWHQCYEHNQIISPPMRP